jgi:hypothetical protein
MTRFLISAAAMIVFTTSANAEIICTQHGGCFETKLTSNGSPYRGLAHKPTLPKAYWGHWCPPLAIPAGEDISYWVKDTPTGEPEVCRHVADAYWSFDRNGFGGHETSCHLTSVKKISRGVRVKGKCQSGTDLETNRGWYRMHLNLRLSDNRLTIEVTKDTQDDLYRHDK